MCRHSAHLCRACLPHSEITEQRKRAGFCTKYPSIDKNTAQGQRPLDDAFTDSWKTPCSGESLSHTQTKRLACHLTCIYVQTVGKPTELKDQS